MFDNLRDESSFYEEEPSDLYQEPEPAPQVRKAAVRRTRPKQATRFMGMTAQQRFLIAFMLMITVCVMGLLAMVVTGRMGLFF